MPRRECSASSLRFLISFLIYDFYVPKIYVCVCVCVLTKELIKVCETILCSCTFILFRGNPVLLRYTRPVCYTSFPPVMQHIFLSRVYIFNAPSVTCMCVSIEKVAFYDFFFHV